MAMYDEYLFLQEEEARLRHLLAESRKRIKDIHRKMADVTQELNVALEFVEALQQNLRMLKYGAPIIGLQRYKEAKHALEANQEVVIDCRLDLQRANERVQEILSASRAFEDQIEGIQKRKDQFGKVVQFPTADERRSKTSGKGRS